MMTDACLSGYAVGESCDDVALARDIGEWDERWRFKREDPNKLAPGAAGLGLGNPLEDPRTVLPAVEGRFLEVRSWWRSSQRSRSVPWNPIGGAFSGPADSKIQNRSINLKAGPSWPLSNIAVGTATDMGIALSFLATT